MFQRGKIFICCLIALAGCSTAPRNGQKPQAGEWDWEMDGAGMPSVVVTESPTLAPPPDSAPVISSPQAYSRVETWKSLNKWAIENKFTMRRMASEPLPTFAVKAGEGLLLLRVNETVATWKGVQFHLAFPPQLTAGELFVHALDLEKNINPLLRGWELGSRTNRVIVIDPGHGGANLGTRSVLDGRYEKEFTLDWAKRVEVLLTTNGWQVFLTRTDDRDLSLSQRVAFAEERKADLFISLHFNASPSATNRVQGGIETYCLTPQGMPSTLVRDFGDDVSLTFPNNAFDEENWRWAFRLHRALLQATGAADRGLRHARFMGVLRGQNRPAVLLEGGYLSDPREAARIAEPAYRQKLAEGVAAALTGQGEVTKPERVQ